MLLRFSSALSHQKFAFLLTPTPLTFSPNGSNSIAIACGVATKSFVLKALLTPNVSSKAWASKAGVRCQVSGVRCQTRRQLATAIYLHRRRG